MRAGVILAVEDWAVTMDNASNWSTDVVPVDDAEASENNDRQGPTSS